MYPDLEIPKWIFTWIILLCVVMSNVFFTLLRAYQASLPIHKYVLLNILFSHLSILWQSSNLVCSVFTITEVIFSVNSSALSCTLYLIRQFQILSTTSCIVLISITRLFANYCTSQYLKLNHDKIGKITSLVIAFLSLFFVLARACDIETVCPADFGCSDFGAKLYISVGILLTFSIQWSNHTPFPFIYKSVTQQKEPSWTSNHLWICGVCSAPGMCPPCST